MDQGNFDTLARLVSAKQSRRAAASLVVAIMAGHDVTGVVGKDRRKRKTQAKSKEKAKAKPCYSGTRCSPGKGRIASGCNFSGSTVFVQGDFRGANLSHSSFRGADLRGADLRGANLSGVCLVDADLTGARLGGANQGGAIRCRTQTDAGLDNSGCDRGTACCPTARPGAELCAVDCDPGCCDANGNCQPGFNDNAACGSGGGACQVCTGQEQCQQQSSPGQPLPSWRCACVPKTCVDLGRECGTAPDGCGGTLECGSCSSGSAPICNDGICSDTCPEGCGEQYFVLADGSTICGYTLAWNCFLPCDDIGECGGDIPSCVVGWVDSAGTSNLPTICDPDEPDSSGVCAIIFRNPECSV